MTHFINVIDVFIVLYYEMKRYIVSKFRCLSPFFLGIGWNIRCSDTKLVCVELEDTRFYCT